MTTKRVMTSVAVLALLGLVAAGYAAGERKAATRDVELPPAAAAAVDKVLPGAETRHVAMEKEGIALYEVTLIQNGAEVTVEVAPDGTVVEVEKAVGQADLPAAVAAALAKAAGDAKVTELERTEVHAELRLVKLDQPAVVFEAEFVKDGKTVEVTIDAAGKVLSQQAGDEDENDDEDDDRKVGLDQAPAAVKAAILKEAGANPVTEIEAETEDGKTVYEAEWVADGKKVELKVAADGTVLGKEVGDDDKDDEDDED